MAKVDPPLPQPEQLSYLGHLDNVGKLCQTGDGDHILIGFQLVPGESIKHSEPHHGMQHFSERDDPLLAISTPPQPGLPSLPAFIPAHSLA